jgi:hypothetical protein
VPDLEVCGGLISGRPERGYHGLACSHTHTAPDVLSLQASRGTADETSGGQGVELFAANALGRVGAISLHLAFLAPATLRRWIEGRAAA